MKPQSDALGHRTLDGSTPQRLNKFMRSNFSTHIVLCALWSALAFSLHLLWEISHVGLYTIWQEADALNIAWSLFHCTLGDVVIAVAGFWLAAVVLWRANWPLSRPWAGSVIVVISTVAFTTWSEWYNVYRVNAWGYAPSMPLIFGIGLTPLMQWLILPPVIVIAYRALWPQALRWLKLHSLFGVNNFPRRKK